ncbi:hypothetical protein ACU686_39450 [Yinghuangia aomiensis]
MHDQQRVGDRDGRHGAGDVEAAAGDAGVQAVEQHEAEQDPQVGFGVRHRCLAGGQFAGDRAEQREVADRGDDEDVGEERARARDARQIRASDPSHAHAPLRLFRGGSPVRRAGLPGRGKGYATRSATGRQARRRPEFPIR